MDKGMGIGSHPLDLSRNDIEKICWLPTSHPMMVCLAAAFTGYFRGAYATKKWFYSHTAGLVTVAAAMPTELVHTGDDVAVRIDTFGNQAS